MCWRDGFNDGRLDLLTLPKTARLGVVIQADPSCLKYHKSFINGSVLNVFEVACLESKANMFNNDKVEVSSH